jgi:hypothetical protein
MWLAALALLAAHAAEPSCRTADARVEDLISSTAAKLQGKEYCQFRLYDTIQDVDGDRQDDFVVVFTVEGRGGGGNNSAQYLAVFASGSDWKSVVTQVGERGVRAIKGISIEDGVIALKTLEYRRDDPMCCPSDKGELRYRLQRGTLVKVD